MIRLRHGVNVEDAKQAIEAAIAEVEVEWTDAAVAVASDLLSGETNKEEAGAAMADLAADLKDAAAVHLEHVLDALWDFKQAPGGPIGEALEGLDGKVWAEIISRLRPLGAKLAVWVRDVAVFDEAERANRIANLTADAIRLERYAEQMLVQYGGADAADGKRAAKRLNKRAAAKRERAARLQSKLKV